MTFVFKSEVANGWSLINPMAILIGAPVYTLANCYWILISVGGLFGLLLPLLVSNKTRREALVYGFVTGAIFGLVVTRLDAHDFSVGTSAGSPDNVNWWGRFWGEFASSLPLWIVYCSIWTISYAVCKAGGIRVEPEAS